MPKFFAQRLVHLQGKHCGKSFLLKEVHMTFYDVMSDSKNFYFIVEISFLLKHFKTQIKNFYFSSRTNKFLGQSLSNRCTFSALHLFLKAVVSSSAC